MISTFAKDGFVKNVTSAVTLEEELQLSWKERGICVADVYSGNWGPCKAITPTFKRLFVETDEEMNLRFLTVDANSVISELEDIDNGASPPKREFPRPKQHLDQIKDTLPARWRPLLEQQCDSPKPLFIFWKEGSLVTHIEGVNTPSICEIVQDLTTIKVPASEFITNTELLRMWGQFFNPGESEVKWEYFIIALNAVCLLTVPLDDEETTILKKQLKVERDRVVHAVELQNWVGKEPNTMRQAFRMLLPGYEDRAIAVRIQQEEEARQAKERQELLEREAIAKMKLAVEKHHQEKQELQRLLMKACLTDLPPSLPSSTGNSRPQSAATADKPPTPQQQENEEGDGTANAAEEGGEGDPEETKQQLEVDSTENTQQKEGEGVKGEKEGDSSSDAVPPDESKLTKEQTEEGQATRPTTEGEGTTEGSNSGSKAGSKATTPQPGPKVESNIPLQPQDSSADGNNPDAAPVLPPAGFESGGGTTSKPQTPLVVGDTKTTQDEQQATTEGEGGDKQTGNDENKVASEKTEKAENTEKDEQGKDEKTEKDDQGKDKKTEKDEQQKDEKTEKDEQGESEDKKDDKQTVDTSNATTADNPAVHTPEESTSKQDNNTSHTKTDETQDASQSPQSSETVKISVEQLISSEGNVDKVQQYITEKSDINVLVDEEKKRTLLHWAAEKGNHKMVQLLLEAKVDHTAKDSDGQTAIFVAQEEGHTDLVKFMMENGVNF